MIENREPYIAKPADANGIVHYEQHEDAVWKTLIERQVPLLANRACDEYLRGLDLLQLPYDRIPQCGEVSNILRDLTGWSLEPVPSVIPARAFFTLLANRKFPAATFIRRREDLDYVAEPDIFHEIFGHCPMLTHAAYADFIYRFSKKALAAPASLLKFYGTLFFYTVEVGLIRTPAGMRIYGGGILSSINESVYALESPVPQRVPFALDDIVKRSFGLDQMQDMYFVIDDFSNLYELLEIRNPA